MIGVEDGVKRRGRAYCASITREVHQLKIAGVLAGAAVTAVSWLMATPTWAENVTFDCVATVRGGSFYNGIQP